MQSGARCRAGARQTAETSSAMAIQLLDSDARRMPKLPCPSSRRDEILSGLGEQIKKSGSPSFHSPRSSPNLSSSAAADSRMYVRNETGPPRAVPPAVSPPERPSDLGSVASALRSDQCLYSRIRRRLPLITHHSYTISWMVGNPHTTTLPHLQQANEKFFRSLSSTA